MVDETRLDEDDVMLAPDAESGPEEGARPDDRIDDERMDEENTLKREFVRSVEEALEAGATGQLYDLVEPLHPADVADLLELFEKEDRHRLASEITDLMTSEVVAELNDYVRDEMMEALPADAVAQIAEQLDTDDAVQLIEDLAEDNQKAILAELDPEDRIAIQTALSYPEETAGRLMNREFVAVPEHVTVGDIIDFLRDGRDLPEDFFEIFVIDQRMHPVGTCQLSWILRTPRNVALGDVMKRDQTLIPATLDQEEVALMFQKYGLISAAVIDEDGRLVGQMTVDDIVHIIAEEAGEDALLMSGAGEGDINEPIRAAYSSRVRWLVANLGTALVASLIIAAFGAAIEQLVALAVLMPIVASIGGNAGTQTMAVTVRAIATNQLTRSNTRRILLRDAPAYGHVMVASIIANCLALATVLFSMQVYDRVVPAKSMPTLYILFIGVLLAIGFDFLLQRLRMEIVDVLGKRADLRMSDRVFGHALRVRTSARPRSTGTFIAQLRDLDQVRDLLTSTTVAAIADLPFFLLFLTILWFIGGVLALVPLGAAVLLVVPGILAQRRMRNYATEAMRESSLRNALLVESVQGIEDIKTLQAEDRFQQQWNHYNSVSGEAQLKLRGLTNGLTIWTRNVQNGVYAGVVFVGAPMVIAGDITTGALVAVSILGSRMMAPMAQVSQLLSRFQQARIAAQGLDEIMALPVDAPEAEQRIPLPAIAGSFALRQAAFAYGEPDAPPALTIAALDIAQGEKIGLLGRNGAGKSTLLQGLSGLMRPVAGEVLIDDLAMHQVDPADLRRDIGVLTQDSRLFHGTLRENLTLGAPQASAQAIWQALAMVGAAPFVKQLRDGLEHVVLEGGKGLSGGQVQTLLLARLLLRDPAVVLLDEPTAAMDETAERQFIQRFKPWAAERTVILATHRMRVLDLVDRVIVIDSGRIVLDQPRDAALRTMQQAKGQQAKASSAA